MTQINLLKNYPITKRDLKVAAQQRTDHERSIARKFEKDFFDGERKYGYGGYNYNPKYWTEVVKDFVDFYKLEDDAKILDVGCGKGFMLYDFKVNFPKLKLYGIDISEYAIENGMEEVKNNLQVASCDDIPFPDQSFDLVISINTIHNL